MRGLWLGFVVALTMAVSSGAQAAKLSYGNILGNWCGDVTDYSFTRTSLTVTFHSDKSTRVWKIKSYEFSDTWINVNWSFGGNTVFAEFSDDGLRMAQQANTGGDKGPRRPFRRCD
jgi:hypothetical protein